MRGVRAEETVPPSGLAGQWVAVPAELRDLVLRSAGESESWAATYLDPCGWCIETGLIHPATSQARDVLARSGAQAVIESAGFVLGEPLGFGRLKRAKAEGCGR